jgi:hypothetical protein
MSAITSGRTRSAISSKPSRPLGLKDRKDHATMLVARAIIDAAKKGEPDPIRLCQAAIEALSGQGRDPR